MNIKSAEFIKSAVNPSGYPEALLPEIAFAGRSNVGKSSMINTLVNRKHLVKTSGTPGHTRLLNFFQINETFFFVDLPGYGYAKVPISVKNKWIPMVETYLSSRQTLKGVVLIMDIRRNPGTEEMYFLKWMNYYKFPQILVLTKADKLSKSHQINRQIAIAQTLSVNTDSLILFSAKSRQGKDIVWEILEKIMEL